MIRERMNVRDDMGRCYPVRVLDDGVRIDAALADMGLHGIDLGRKHPVPAHHTRVD